MKITEPVGFEYMIYRDTTGKHPDRVLGIPNQRLNHIDCFNDEMRDHVYDAPYYDAIVHTLHGWEWWYRRKPDGTWPKKHEYAWNGKAGEYDGSTEYDGSRG